MDSVEYVSEGKLKELREELSRLKIKDRLEISERIAHARSLGDLKENAEYHKAKDEQGFLESRMAELERIIKNAKIIEKENGEFVRLGSVVRLKKNNSPEETYEYQIVGSQESDLERGKISFESPLGNALMNKKKGDEVILNNHKGETIYHILEVS